MTVKEIIEKYLKDNGFDGLYNPEDKEGCGCELGDLCPCEEDFGECKPGYKIAVANSEFIGWRISPEKEKE